MIHQVEFRPYFVHWSCPHCDFNFKSKHCVSDGKYCAMQNSLDDKFTGKDVIMENLRQHCLFELLFNKESAEDFFKYIEYVHEKCGTRIDSKCSKEGVKSIKFSMTELNTCVDKSFGWKEGQSRPDFSTEDNTVLADDLQQWRNYGTHLYPSVVINDETFRGQLNPYNVFEDICESFSVTPKPCKKWIEREGLMVGYREDSGISGQVVAFIIGIMIVVNGLLIVLYRRCLKQEMEDDMKVQVNSAVSQYVALSQIKELQDENAPIAAGDTSVSISDI
uniref:Vacuolar sorting receptor thioredoxin-like domain-containing protein n=1 Tax=Strombidium inclinatum TaxID=197538 RepID=A0A7S3MUI4_9SPIT|mmetsp:Transcript_14873/g.23049  ORF Transcript_14873/g.23049 Transcript_14873/m.23049 type:complete len:277 (+) Transcript_14873:655-1485(+)